MIYSIGLIWALLATGWEMNYKLWSQSFPKCVSWCVISRVLNTDAQLPFCQMLQQKVLKEKIGKLDTSGCWRKDDWKFGVWYKYLQTTCMWLWHLKQQWKSGCSTHSDTDQWSILLGWRMTRRGTEKRNQPLPQSFRTLKIPTTPTVYIFLILSFQANSLVVHFRNSQKDPSTF